MPSIAADVRKKLVALEKMHRDRWRAMAQQLADGSGSPNALDVVESAAALGIASPVDAIEADAAALRELRAAEAAIESCRARCRELLDPWKGNAAKAQAALAAAEAEVARLKEILAAVSDGCSESFWTNIVYGLQRRHPRVFPENQA
jgi:hypothetical protein